VSNEYLAIRIAALKERFLDQLPERMRQLEDALALIGQDDAAATAAHLVVHSLAGAGATFGCPEVGKAARQMETTLFPAGNPRGRCAADYRQCIPELLDALRLAVGQALDRRTSRNQSPVGHISQEP
jgi:HPt (histidine-containing phosphotransfer) domain-containing protein